MKFDELQAPAATATTPQRSLTDKIGEAFAHTLEFLVPPLKHSLAWDRSEFESMFPDWYMNTHPTHQTTTTTMTSSANTTAKTTEPTSGPNTSDVSFRQQHVASSAA